MIKIARFEKVVGVKINEKIKLNIILAILLSIFLVFRISTKESTPDFRFSTTEVVTGDIIESVMSSGKIIPEKK